MNRLDVRRACEWLMLSIEHPRCLAAAIELVLGEHGGGLTLHVCDGPAVPAPEHPRSPAERVLDVLAGADAPRRELRRELRDACRLRNTTLVDALAALQADGRVRVDAGLVQLALL